MAVDIAMQVRVTGRVQGVWFRGWTKDEATRRGLRGWVQNEADGSVRALIAGSEEAVRAMLDTLHEGPEAARVDRVAAEAVEAEVPAGFEVRR